jgi:putative endonuclease
MFEKEPVVYIMASRRNGTLYIGVTSDLIKRVWEHRTHAIEGFTKKYDVRTLMYYEVHSEMLSAILREKQLKRWRRKWKLQLIETANPSWQDRWNEIAGFPLSRE